MLNFATGITLPYPDKIKEGFERQGNHITCNISFEKLEPLTREFLLMLQEPLFLILHIPLSQQEESEIPSDEYGTRHDKVMYLDGCTKEQISGILNKYGEILFNDGMSQFGIASHKTRDELFIMKYKIVCLFSEDINQYLPLLDKYGIYETESLTTAWNTFSRKKPGECRSVEINNKTIYNVVEELTEFGLYTSKTVDN